MIGYKIFKKEDHFFKWQKYNPDYKIINIQPVLNNIQAEFMDNDNTHTAGSMNTDISVFVTYMFEEEEDSAS